MARPERQRDWIPELDVLRSLGCVAVVGFHLVWAAGALESDPHRRLAWSGVAQFLLLGAPIFAFLSGLLAFYHYPARTSLRGYWWSRLLYLGVPYLAWTALYLLLTPGGVWGVPLAVALRRVLLALVFGPRHLGFVAALFQFSLLLPLWRWLWQRVDRPVLLIAALLCGVAWIDGGPRLLPRDLAYVSEAPLMGCVLAWLPYLALGAWASEHLDALEALLPRPRGAYALSGLMLAASAVTVATRATAGRTEMVTARTALLGLLVAFTLCLPGLLFAARRVRETRWASLCREVARYSPAVFFVHVLPLSLAEFIVPGRASAGWALVIYTFVTWLGTGLLIDLAHRSETGRLLAGLGRRPQRLTGHHADSAAADDEEWDEEVAEPAEPHRALG